MAIHFAAARTGTRSPVARVLQKRPIRCAANDNGAAGEVDEPLFGTQAAAIRAALAHLRQHGMAAASDAHARALEAFAVRDLCAYAHWRAVCEALDRQMAASLAS